MSLFIAASKPKRKKAPRWPVGMFLLFLIIGGGVFAYVDSRPDAKQIRASNQKAAIKNILDIRRALNRFKKADYDANGKDDYPVSHLRKLRETRLVNKRAIELLTEEQVLADCREKKPKPLSGYLFTLVHPDPEEKWPAGGQSKSVWIYAMPSKVGVSGACYFYAEVQGPIYYTALRQKEGIPPFPEEENSIWKVLPQSAMPN